MLTALQAHTFDYFRCERDRYNGLIKDNTREDSPCSITAVGLALACYPVAVERRWTSRAEAAATVLATLRFFWESEQSKAPEATGYKGFYYHFLDMESGRRMWKSELSTIDTTFLLAGGLMAAQYFDRGNETESEIRTLANALYYRADWQWALNHEASSATDCLAVSHGWKPERGFLAARWQGYNEALLLYALALGSPTYPISDESYAAWTKTYKWKTIYGHKHLYAGPLFVHQLSHIWIDFRGIQDPYMQAKGIDYAENSRRATYVQREYAIRNPRGYNAYGPDTWGITASAGPGRHSLCVDGRMREFYDYQARGVPWGLDDGTLSPWAVAASLPFAPEIVLPALSHLEKAYPEMTSKYGFKCSFNPTFPDRTNSAHGWVSQGYYGLDQGPIVLMIENYLTEKPWRWMKQCPSLVTGLRRAGFVGGWLDG